MGTYVPEERHPGKSATDCQACPYGKHTGSVSFLFFFFFFANRNERVTNFTRMIQIETSLRVLIACFLLVWTVFCLFETDGDARRKIRIKPLKETYLGVAQTLFDP